MKSVFLIFVIFLFGCDSEQQKVVKDLVSNMDTIQIGLVNKSVKNRNRDDFNKYYNRFGLVIQKYYQIVDSLAVDLDLNGSVDTIVLLSPKSLESAEYFNKNIDSLPKRLLVEVLNIKGKSKIRNIYQNLISNAGGVLSKYIGIEKTTDGFVLKHEAGSKYSWVLNTEFKIHNNRLTLANIHKECVYDEETITYDYNYDDFPLDKLNLLDSMLINCNCDQSWKILESKN